MKLSENGKMSSFVSTAVACSCWIWFGVPVFGQCEPELTGFGRLGMNRHVLAIERFDDGTGPAIYAAGGFLGGGCDASGHVLKWDGFGWSGLGDHKMKSLDGVVHALKVFDDGSGPALYAGGYFTHYGFTAIGGFARWDGDAWVEPNFRGFSIRALHAWDDGTGPSLLLVGGFTRLNHQAGADGIAKWDGVNVSPLGEGVKGIVRDVVSFDDGTGPVLYVCGSIYEAGGIPVKNVAKWDGSSWSALGEGLDMNTFAVEVFDDGSGPALYAGGYFSEAGGKAAKHVAKWDGIEWSEVGGGADDYVLSLAAFDDGSGPALYAGGEFFNIGGVSTIGLAKWDGQVWASVTEYPLNYINDLTVIDDGPQGGLYAVGGFTTMGLPVSTVGVARWGCPVEECYADCDLSTGEGTLDIFDFLCFQSGFVNGDSRACDCDGSTGPCVCDVFDFLCFQDAFVAGCP